MNRSTKLGVIGAAAALVLVPASGSGQYVDTELAGPQAVTIEFARPFFSDDGFTGLTGLGYLSGNLGSGSTRFLFELPFARGAIDGLDGSSSMIGSPFVGAAFGVGDEGGVSGAAGVRIPVPESFVFGEDDFAIAVGIAGDPDRMEAFLPENAAVSGSVRFDAPSEDGLMLRGQLDLTTWIDAGRGGDALDLLAGWGGLVGYEGESLFTSAALTGRFVATAEGDDRVWHQLEGRIGVIAGGARPWISARVPVQGGFVDALDWVVGAGVGIPIG